MARLLLLFVITFTIGAIGATNKTPGLSPLDPLLKDPNMVQATVLPDFKTFFYNQTLDHFNYRPESYATFPQRYIINTKWWGGPKNNAPIVVYFGAEGPIDQALTNLGFFTENAPRFNALLVYLEHRFYGESNPLGSNGDPNSVEAMTNSVKDVNIRGYFNSAQALADYAELLLHIKNQLEAHDSPIIVVGGSYGGMLAAWFRLKYPHIAIGALASSAPVLYFDDIIPQDGYYSVVTKDFKETSENCYNTIKKSWNEIDRVASMPNGLAILTQKFKTCSPLNNAFELKSYLKTMYAHVAQYNEPPNYPTTQICKGIDDASNAYDILDRVFAGVVAYKLDKPCYDLKPAPDQTSIGWSWQTCSDIVIPIGITSNVSMFPSSPYDAQIYIDNCKRMYSVTPRPRWATTYYGGHDIRLVLNRFASNIIFSNGLYDPYSSGGVLENISDSIIAIKTINGSHCLDLVSSKETDPEWLVEQRNDEVKIIKTWLENYYQDIRSLGQRSTS